MHAAKIEIIFETAKKNAKKIYKKYCKCMKQCYIINKNYLNQDIFL